MGMDLTGVRDFIGLQKSSVGFCPECIQTDNLGEMVRTGRPRSKVKRTATLKAAAYPSEVTTFNTACRSAKLPPADVLRELAAAWVVFVDEHPRASLHFKIEVSE